MTEIYEQAFAPHHRVPFAELARTGTRDMLVAALDDGEPVGFAALRLLDVAGWTFLRYYMASDPAKDSAAEAAELADLVLAIYSGRYSFGPENPMVAAALASIGGGMEGT